MSHRGFLWMDFHLHLVMRWNFIMSFLIKLIKVQKHLSKQSLPEDGLNTRNRAGNDSKEQAYTHATVFKPNNFSIKTRKQQHAGKYK